MERELCPADDRISPPHAGGGGACHSRPRLGTNGLAGRAAGGARSCRGLGCVVARGTAAELATFSRGVEVETQASPPLDHACAKGPRALGAGRVALD